MNIDEAQMSRDALEIAVQDQLDKFSKETGLRIDELTFERLDKTRQDGSVYYEYLIDLDVSL